MDDAGTATQQVSEAIDPATEGTRVVTNKLGQYAFWQLGQPLPAGWTECFRAEQQSACRAYIQQHWTGHDRPTGETPAPRLTDLFEAVVDEFGDQVALSVGDSDTTYRELDAITNQWARVLIAEGVGPETVVGVSIERAPRLIIAMLAIVKAGGAYLALDADYPASRLQYMIEDARPRLVLRSHDRLAVPAGVLDVDVRTDAFAGRAAAFDGGRLSQAERREPLRSDHLMYVIYTSGSTGEPKAVAITHEGVECLRDTQRQFLAPGPGDRVLQWASFNFDAAFWDTTLALLSGATLVVPPGADTMPGDPLHFTLERECITHAVLPPAVLSTTEPEGVLIGGTILSTGDSCTPSIVERWAPGRRFINGYGPTEMTVGVSMSEPIQPGEPITIGRPWPGNEVRILDQALHPVPDGADGELYLCGAGMARGYLRKPDETALKFLPDPLGSPGSRMYRSGDRGVRGPDGTLTFTGRTDRQVKLRGFRIELEEIETRLRDSPEVDLAVAQVVGSLESARIIAFATVHAGSSPQGEALKTYLATVLPPHMVPSNVIVLPGFPITVNGKIDRERLVRELHERSAAEVEPGSGTAGGASPVLTIAAEILEVSLAPSDNFFDRGGHSVAAAQLAQRVQRETGVRLKLRDVFESASMHELDERWATALAAQAPTG